MRVLIVIAATLAVVPSAAAEPHLVANAPASSFRAVYALTAGQSADPHAAAAIVHEIKVANGWYPTQTNGLSPSWLRDATGDPAVAIVHVSADAATFAAAPNPLAFAKQQILAAAPLAAQTEKTVVWIDVDTSTGACGISDFGEGSFSVLFEAACRIYPSATSSWPSGATYLQVHEMTHGFGAVFGCAPHYDGTGHVNDDPRDVLYAGSRPRDWAHLMLDPGHDDYFGTGRTDCPDIALSPFWTPATVYPLDVHVAGAGSVDTSRETPCPPLCTVSAYEGATVSLTAKAQEGSRFVGWSGACTSPVPTCTLLLDHGTSVTATFAPVPVRLTVTKVGLDPVGGSVTSSPTGIDCGATCSASFDYGTTVTLSPAAGLQSTFVGWSGECSGSGSCTVTLTRDLNMTATFDLVCVVPAVVGRPLRVAAVALVQAHCGVGPVSQAHSKSVRAGLVVSQASAPGTRLPSATRVALVLSRGPKPKKR